MSFFAADDTWALWAVILIGVAVSITLERSTRWGERLSGPVLAILLAMLLSNLRIMPTESPVYDVIGDYLVPTAVSLLLFRAGLFDILKTSRGAFVAMQIAVIATVLGSLLGGFVLNACNLRPIDPRGDGLAKVSGMMAASYTGGGVNFFAMKDIYHVDEGLTASLLVADNFVMAAAFLALFSCAASPFMRRCFPHPHSVEHDASQPSQQAAARVKPGEISPLHLALGLAIAVSIAAVSARIATGLKERLIAGEDPGLVAEIVASLLGSKFVWVTLLTITAATLCGRYLRRISGTEEVGGFLLYVFLFSIGLPSEFLSVLKNVPAMFLLCTIIAAVNIGVTLGVGKLLRLNLEELLLACNASLGGPPTAAAMAVSLGWKKLVTPGLLIGLWGYVVGTAVGVVVTELLRR